MHQYKTLYDILNISGRASPQEIKTFYRKLAQQHHPDKNNNSAESQARFSLIANAYNILIDPCKREAYDTFLKNSSVIKKQHGPAPKTLPALPAGTDPVYRSYDTLLNRLNFLLWEIEDYISNKKGTDREQQYGNTTPDYYLLKILTFIDRWVLSAAGYRDYFMQARQKEDLDPLDYMYIIGAKHSRFAHCPFTGIDDYFYDIRKRMDKFLAAVSLNDLAARLPDHNVLLLDCIIEAENLTVHYLGHLLKAGSGPLNRTTPFEHSRPFFDIKHSGRS